MGRLFLCGRERGICGNFLKKVPTPSKTFWGKRIWCPQVFRRGRLSLRLGHARGLTAHRAVIQDPRAATLPRRPARGWTNAKAAIFPRCCPIRCHAKIRLPDRVTGRKVMLRTGVNRTEPVCVPQTSTGADVTKPPSGREVARLRRRRDGRSLRNSHPVPICDSKWVPHG